MSINRVATATQTAYFLAQIQNAGAQLDKTQTQIASTKNATTYAGFAGQTQVLTATLAATARNAAYTSATSLAQTQADLQDSQLSSLSDLGTQLKKTLSDSLGNNDASTLMEQAKNIFDQASAVLNAKDANGDYIYGGGRTDTPPFTATSLSDLASMPSVASAFANGDLKKSVQVADGVNVAYGVTASDIGTGLMQSLKDLASFDAGSSGNFSAGGSLSQAQSDFIGGAVTSAGTAVSQLTSASAANGYVYDRLTDAVAQQGTMDTLYSGFAGKIQNTDLAAAATQLSLNQTQLQASLAVTSTLHQLTLLNYMGNGG